MEYITTAEQSNLSFVLCGYTSEMIYHDYDKDKDRLSAGKSLTVETAKSIFNFINNIETIQNYSFPGIIPKNILKYKTDEKFVVWTTPAGIKDIIYKKGLPIKSGQYYVPRMVWKLNAKTLSVWAITKDVKSEKDKLYQAPFFNIYDNGSICMGNSKFLAGSYDYSKIIKTAEAGFWDSMFTHTNNNELLSMNFTDWCNDKELRISKCEKLLVDTKKTIKHIL